MACGSNTSGIKNPGDNYHPGNYNYPENNEQRFEICAGAILTQNTAWINVEKALINIDKLSAMNAFSIVNTGDSILREAVKPAGYFNQKAVYLKTFALFYIALKGRIPSRNELLSVKGIGPETADSILLYAYNQPEFVIDAYTKRIFSFLGFFPENTKYDEIKKMFINSLPADFILFQEYHALIVEHAKRYYSGKSDFKSCPLLKRINRPQ